MLADHTKLGTDTMFQTVPTDVITRLVTDDPPAHDDRAATELQALADQGVQITVAGGAAGSGPGGEGAPPGSRPRRDTTPLPGQRRTHGGSGPGPQTRRGTAASAGMLADQPGERTRVADLRHR